MEKSLYSVQKGWYQSSGRGQKLVQCTKKGGIKNQVVEKILYSVQKGWYQSSGSGKKLVVY